MQNETTKRQLDELTPEGAIKLARSIAFRHFPHWLLEDLTMIGANAICRAESREVAYSAGRRAMQAALKKGLATPVRLPKDVWNDGSEETMNRFPTTELLLNLSSDDPLPSESTVHNDLLDRLNRMVDSLPDTQRTVIIHLYGLRGTPVKNEVSLGKKLRISRQAISVHRRRALKKLRFHAHFA
jgi:RNA polymerase sigma factor (sigma-70 family)